FRREPFEELEAVRSRPQNAVELAAAFERKTGRRVDGVVRAFLRRGPEVRDGSRRQDGRNAQGVDEGGGGRAAPQLALAGRPSARPSSSVNWGKPERRWGTPGAAGAAGPAPGRHSPSSRASVSP